MVQLNGFPLYQFTFDVNSYEDGVSLMSLVKSPAVDKDFITLSKNIPVKLHLNDEKRIVTGVALRANYPIFRDQDNKQFYFEVSPETILGIVQKFMKENKLSEVNIEHLSNMKVDEVYLIESFILDDKHKLSYPEFKDIESGSWMVSYKVDNPEIWQRIKEGELKGFSVELLGKLIPIEDDNTELYNLIKFLEG